MKHKILPKSAQIINYSASNTLLEKTYNRGVPTPLILGLWDALPSLVGINRTLIIFWLLCVDQNPDKAHFYTLQSIP